MECPLAIIAGGRPVKQVCDVLGVARSNVSVRRSCPVGWQDGRCVGRTDDAELVAELREAVVDLPSYGFAGSGASFATTRRCTVNIKRNYRAMRVHGLLLQRRPKRPAITRRHDGRVAVTRSNQRWVLRWLLVPV
jgi:hypothetical protein